MTARFVTGLVLDSTAIGIDVCVEVLELAARSLAGSRPSESLVDGPRS